MIVWIFQTGEPLHSDKIKSRPMRAMNLANKLASSGHNVVIWSANFYHQERKHRSSATQDRIVVSKRIQVQLINSPGYNKSISIKRFVDHIELSRNLMRILKKEVEQPDIAFVGYPPIEFAYSASRWLRSKDIPYVVDVKDQWPHIISEYLPPIFNQFSRILLYPYYCVGSNVLQKSTAICSMSRSFLKWAQLFAGRVKSNDFVFPLTSFPFEEESIILEDIKKYWAELNVVPKNYQLRIIFVGTIGRSFDFNPIVEAAQRAQDMGKEWQFVICGDGDYREKLMARCIKLKNIIFPGWINDQKYMELSKMCDIALAPYINTDNFKMNIPNKIIDYLRLGIPILSPLDGEVEQLVNRSYCGLKYNKDQQFGLFEKIDFISSNANEIDTMANNAKITYLDEFDAHKVYNQTIRRLEKLVAVRVNNSIK